MRITRWLALIAVAALVEACGGGAAPTSPSQTTLPPQASPSTSPNPAASSPRPSNEIEVGGSRPVTVRLPPGAGAEPAPLAIVLHGFGSSGLEHERYFGLDRYAADQGVVLAYPDGTRNRNGERFWNATDACCNFYGDEADDVAYIVGVVEEIGRATPIDPKRVFLVGHSNGGFMSYRLACEEAGVFAAIVSLAGATFDDDGDCHPSEPVAVAQIHGTADDTILFGGGTLDFGGSAPPGRFPGAKATVAAWAVYGECVTTFETLPETLDIDDQIDGPNGPTETTIETAKGCRPGGTAELWTIQGGSHAPRLSPSFASYVIDFLLAHTKP
jgi:polyhydroxybutyrate depolymerase